MNLFAVFIKKGENQKNIFGEKKVMGERKWMNFFDFLQRKIEQNDF
jgi:hypothetical protein